MKVAPFLLLALKATSVSACASYFLCYCPDSDGSANDDITSAVCNSYAGGLSVNYVGYTECLQSDWLQSAWINCDWRVQCQNQGSTGSDAKCRWKESDCV